MESANVNGGLTANSESSLEIRVALIISVVISFLILAGNLFTVVSIFCFIKRRNTSSFLLITISLIDILNILGPNTVSFFVFFDKESNFHNDFTLCRIQAWAIVFLRSASALAILFLSFDRVFITVTPRFYRKKWKGKLFVAFFFGKWVVSAFIATWPLLWLNAFQISKDTRDTLCLFLYENPFAGFFVVFLLCSMLVCCLCFYVIFSTSNKKSFSTEAAKDEEFGYNTKQVSLVDSTDEKDLNGLTSVLVGVYFCCIMPWMVAITLSLFSVEYSPSFGLCAIQLPMVSSLLNPLIYGIMWLPYKKAYIRALTWPFAKCCCNGNFQKSPRSRSHNFNTTPTLGHSGFWISDGFIEDDVDQEDAFNIVFGPTSYIKPLDFNTDELKMFEQTRDSSSKANGVIQNSAVATNEMIWRESGDPFQNILDFIETMTEGHQITRSNK